MSEKEEVREREEIKEREEMSEREEARVREETREREDEMRVRKEKSSVLSSELFQLAMERAMWMLILLYCGYLL